MPDHRLLSAVPSLRRAPQAQGSLRVTWTDTAWAYLSFRKGFLGWGIFCCLLIGSSVTAFYVLFYISIPSRGDSRSPPSIAFEGFAKDDIPTKHQTELWLDLLPRSVTPRMCHSHNDYWRTVPLFSALSAGCTGIEADVWLSDNGKELLVGHDRNSLLPNRSLQKMYLEPLLEILKRRNPDRRPENQRFYYRAKGVFEANTNATVVLMIDVKEHPTKVWPMVLEQLETLRQKRFLTRYEQPNSTTDYPTSQGLWIGPIVVVGSGSLDFAALMASYSGRRFQEYHDTFLDAPLQNLSNDHGVRTAAEARNETSAPEVVYHAADSYYASASFKQTIGEVKFGFSGDQLDTLRRHIRNARERGLQSRYWDIPDWPKSYRDYIWSVLVREGVGMLSVDDVEDAAHGGWTTEYIDLLPWMITVSIFIAALAIGLSLAGCRAMLLEARIGRSDSRSGLVC